MNNPKEQIEIISHQEMERIQSLMEKIEEGTITNWHILRDLQERIKMMNHINRINKEQ